MQLRPYQQAAVEAVYDYLRHHDDNPCVVLPTGCHAKDHPILMYDGSLRPVQDIRVGDDVMGPDSRPRRVLALCQGEDELFRIVPHRGEAFVVNGDHILSLVSTNENKPWPCNRKGGEIENLSVRAYLGKSRSWRHLRKLYRVPIDFATRCELPVPPYVLGLLLGDGCLRDSVDLTTADDELADTWQRYAHTIGCDTTVNANDGRCATYTLKRGRGRFNVLTESLDALGLVGTDSASKFVPAIYLTASREERLSLLAGLMDSDGSVSKSGFEITTKSKELASDIVFLARSLGFAAHCVQKYCYCQTGAGGWFFRIHIYGDATEVPCRLPRKRPRPRKQKKSVLRTGFTVESVGRGSFFGFLLDGDQLYVDGHFVVHHNSGKTPVLATICKDAVMQWNGRVLVLAHVKELLQQAADKLQLICPDVKFGIFSAGLRRRDTEHPVIIAGIQSVYKRACDLDAFDLIIVDEAHLIAPDGEGMYRQFLAEAKVVNPRVRTIGLTATPYRLKSGMICGPDNILNAICFEVGVRELIRDGYICPLVTKAGREKADMEQVHVRGGEFVAEELEDLMDQDRLVESACQEIVELTRERHACLIFASGVKHAQHIQRVLREQHGIECGLVSGQTPASARDELLARFRGESANGLFEQAPLKYLVNVNVLTTGFDAPNIDCVAMLRPTLSPGLYYQCLGRGFRLHPSKKNCLVLDFGGNVLRHGPVDQIRPRESHNPSNKGGEAPAKECPECHSLIATGYAACPDCGYEFPKPERASHDPTASTESVLSGQVTETVYAVKDVRYSVHIKQRADETAPKTMRVDYRVGFHQYRSEWVCFEHSGYARWKAETWWQARSPDPVPDTAERAVELANAGALALTKSITVRTVAGEKFDRIVDYELGEKPEPVPVEAYATTDLDDIPF